MDNFLLGIHSNLQKSLVDQLKAGDASITFSTTNTSSDVGQHTFQITLSANKGIKPKTLVLDTPWGSNHFRDKLGNGVLTVVPDHALISSVSAVAASAALSGPVVLGSTGDIWQVAVDGTPIGTYKQSAGDTTATILGASIAQTVALLGYSATSSTGTLTVSSTTTNAADYNGRVVTLTKISGTSTPVLSGTLASGVTAVASGAALATTFAISAVVDYATGKVTVKWADASQKTGTWSVRAGIECNAYKKNLGDGQANDMLNHLGKDIVAHVYGTTSGGLNHDYRWESHFQRCDLPQM